MKKIDKFCQINYILINGKPIKFVNFNKKVKKSKSDYHDSLFNQIDQNWSF